MKGIVPFVLFLLLGAQLSAAQGTECRVLCAPEFKVEPTLTFTKLFRPAPLLLENGARDKERHEKELELILSLDLGTRASWLGFTIEAILLPFDRESTPELEFEANFTWLPAERTRGWVHSHFDVVDKFSEGERPTDRRAYTHKLNFELDTSLALFKRLPEGRWLRGVELEGSLDYVATGLPRTGDLIGSTRYLRNASSWSFSIVLVLPVAPL